MFLLEKIMFLSPDYDIACLICQVCFASVLPLKHIFLHVATNAQECCPSIFFTHSSLQGHKRLVSEMTGCHSITDKKWFVRHFYYNLVV